MKTTVQEMDEKNKVLSSWTKESVGQVVAMKNSWNNFLALLDNQQFYINRQVTILSFLIKESQKMNFNDGSIKWRGGTRFMVHISIFFM